MALNQVFKSKAAALWLSVGALILGLTVAACSANSPVLPLELAFLRPTSIAVTGTLTTGITENYASFDLRRERDGLLITQPIAAYVRTIGADSTQSTLRDDLNNLISPNRAVVLLGNGQLDAGVLQPPPTPYPNVATTPLAPYVPPTGWQSRATFAYTPNQTDIPNRAADNRFGVYLASVLPFKARLGFATQDTQNVVVETFQTVEFPPGPIQSVSVLLDNTTGTTTEPIVVAICNQINAAILVGIQAGDTTTLDVPALGIGLPSPLNTDTAYRAEAYRFDNTGAVLAVSINPGDPTSISVPLLGAENTTGLATVALSTTFADDQVTCFGELVKDMATIAPNLLFPSL